MDRPIGDFIGKEMTMVTKKRTTGKAKATLKLKKETIKDLQPGRASVKGGKGAGTAASCGDLCTVGCTATCLYCKTR